MMKKRLENYLLKEGFFPITSNVSDISAVVKFESNLVNILQIIDYKKDLYLDKEQFEEVKNSLRGAFRGKGIPEIHILTLILSEDIEKGMELGREDAFCWQVDMRDGTLLIEKDKQPDFYGMRMLIQAFLEKWRENPAQFDEKEEEIGKKSKSSKLAEYLRKAPYVSLSMVIINLFLCFCCIVNPEFFYGNGCISLAYVEKGEWYRLITSIFLHGSIDHYFSNMLLLYFMGDMLERKAGWGRFLLVYLLSGVFGNIVSCVHEYCTGSYYVSFGASGAVFGIIGMLFYMVLRRREDIRISVLSMVLMVAYCIYSSFVGDRINVAAHLGGLLGGMLLMFVFGQRRKSHES